MIFKDKRFYLFLLCILFVSVFIRGNDSAKYDFNNLLDINGGKLIVKSKTLILFVNLKKLHHRGALLYGRAVRNKYRNIKKFSVIGIVSNDIKLRLLKKIIKEYKLNFQIVYDKENKVFDNLEICRNCGGIVFIRNNTIRQFISPINSNRDIRKIVEWELFKNVKEQNSPVIEKKLLKGNSIDWLYVEPLNSSKYEKIKIKGKTVITFFSTMGGFCRTGKRKITMKKIKNELPEVRIISIMLYPLMKTDIEYLKTINLNFIGDIYFAKNFFSNDELYLTNVSVKKDPYTIVVDEKGKIIYSENSGDSEQEVYKKIINIFKGGKNEEN